MSKRKPLPNSLSILFQLSNQRTKCPTINGEINVICFEKKKMKVFNFLKIVCANTEIVISLAWSRKFDLRLDQATFEWTLRATSNDVDRISAKTSEKFSITTGFHSKFSIVLI